MAAGCVEVERMDLELQQWTHVTSLPQSLEIEVPKGKGRKGGTMVPELFGSSLALGAGVLAATGATDDTGFPPFVAVFSLMGSDWVQMDALECYGAGCSCPASSRSSCFGSALAISGKRVAVGNSQNASVLIYEQSKGVPIAWDLVKIVTSPYSHATMPSMFGASVALSSTILVVGSPSNGAGSRAVFFNMARGPAFGSPVYDTLDHCCKLGLPCCVSGLVGAATAVTEYDDEAAVIVGDPRSAQVHIAKCNTTALKQGSSSSIVCIPSVTVQGASNAGQNPSAIGSDGFGGSLAYGGQMILMGHPARHCSSVGPMDACGTVCEVPLCAPGYCLLYEMSLDQEFCQQCVDKSRCKGGMRTCSASDAGALGAMALSTILFFILFCTLYTVSAFSRGTGPIAVLCELFCCLPMMGSMREGLLSDAGGEEGGEEEESDSDVEHEGYIPPQVKAALMGITTVGPSSDEVPQQGAKEGAEEAGEAQPSEDGVAGGRGEGEEAGAQVEKREGEEEGQKEEGQEVGEANCEHGAENGEACEVAAIEGGDRKPNVGDEIVDGEGEGDGPAKTSAPRKLQADYADDDETSVGVSLNYFQCKIW